jgi:hypothetical protein
MAMDEWDELLELSRLDPLLATATWVPLARAEAAAGVSRSALRSWYRSGQIASRLVDGPHGPQRLVPLEAVLHRADLSPRLRARAGRAVTLEAEVALLRDRVAALEARLAALESPSGQAAMATTTSATSPPAPSRTWSPE